MWLVWPLVSVLAVCSALLLEPAQYLRDTVGTVRRRGYPAETHRVRTADGYLLTLHRIPAPARPAVFLQHGLASTSKIWVIGHRPLGLLLWERGYDVWLGNARGNKYSRTYFNTSRQYWDFSWDEMGRYDMPAVLDYVLLRTGQKDLQYVGHSMGVSMMAVLLSTRPEYNARVSYVFALAPAVFVTGMRSRPLTAICTVIAPGALARRDFGLQRLLADMDKIATTLSELCASGSFFAVICFIFYILFGGPTSDVGLSSMPEVISELPTSTSLKTFAHIGQGIKGRFRPYQENWMARPPADYDLQQVTVPFALFYSEDDYAVHPKNMLKLNRSLPYVDYMYKVSTPGFNHLDFLFGKSAEKLIYNKIFQIMNHLESNSMIRSKYK